MVLSPWWEFRNIGFNTEESATSANKSIWWQEGSPSQQKDQMIFPPPHTFYSGSYWKVLPTVWQVFHSYHSIRTLLQVRLSTQVIWLHGSWYQSQPHSSFSIEFRAHLPLPKSRLKCLHWSYYLKHPLCPAYCCPLLIALLFMSHESMNAQNTQEENPAQSSSVPSFHSRLNCFSSSLTRTVAASQSL